jgi:hypothetical protein
MQIPPGIRYRCPTLKFFMIYTDVFCVGTYAILIRCRGSENLTARKLFNTPLNYSLRYEIRAKTPPLA